VYPWVFPDAPRMELFNAAAGEPADAREPAQA
jgi:hypothetical protein